MIGNQYTSIINSSIAEAQSLRGLKDGWKQKKKNDHFNLSKMKYQDTKLKITRVEGVFPINIDKVQLFYFDQLEAQKRSRPHCERLEKVEQIDQDNFIVHLRTKSKFLISGREVLAVQNRTRLSENELVITRSNITEHASVPINKDYVRADEKIYAVFLTWLSPTETKIEAFFVVDPLGKAPKALANSALDEEFLGFTNDIKEMQAI